MNCTLADSAKNLIFSGDTNASAEIVGVVVRAIGTTFAFADAKELIGSERTRHEYERSALMLVLSRRNGEEILLGDDVRIRVVAVRGHRVQLAIDAPKEVSIMRGELQPQPSKTWVPKTA